MRFTLILAILDKSNLRLLDSINRPENLVQKAMNIGLSGIAITDHEALCCHEWVSQKQKELIEAHSDFKVAYGNEIYLTDSRKMGQQYYHFILIAKDAIGHKMMRELSSDAWLNSYYDRGMRRVPTLKSELAGKVEKYGKGHLIMSSACLGGEINASLLQMVLAEREGREQDRKKYHKQIVDIVRFTRELAGDDMYLEIAPGTSAEQIIVNNRMVSLAKCFGMKILCGSDSHYLNKDDRWVHKAYLNSKGGDREVDSFYEFAYLQDDDEVRQNIYETELNYDELVANSQEVYDKIENFSLLHKQHVPQVAVPDYPKKKTNTGYPTLDYLYNSDDQQDRYWVNYCVDELENRGLKNDTYMARLEEEADIKKTIGDKLETNMFSYPIFLQHYIDMFWACDSTVGAGRGSSCSGLNHWLLGITQLDPIVHSLPFWRYMNKDRTEIGDIDIDICPSKRPEIFRRIREERGELGCVQVCTFGTETTRSAIQTACRGYRSEEYPKGINNDISQYLTSLIPSERGFVWPVSDAVNGNEEKGRKPVREFINEVEKYPGLLEIIQKIEGLVKQYGIHASGVVFPDEDPYEMSAFMRAPDGTVVTQFSLHPQENMGLTKYDFLVTEIQDVITQCLFLLQENGLVEKDLSLRELYNKYLHPDILPVDDYRIWDALSKGNILKLFQFDSQVGSQTAKLLKPQTPREMANCNSVMRLMATEKGGETPSDRYARMKGNMRLWYAEMEKYGLTKAEQKVLEPYYLPAYATPGQQEDMMLILMDKNVCGFSLKEANNCRKICAKKKMSEIPKLHELVLNKAKSPELGKYVWDTAILPQMGYSFNC